MGRQENVGADHAALSGVVAVLAVILAIQSLPGSVGGRSDSGLSCASLLPVPSYAVPCKYPVPEKATAYPVTIFLYIFFSNSSVLTLASRFDDRVERSRLIKFHLFC